MSERQVGPHRELLFEKMSSDLAAFQQIAQDFAKSLPAKAVVALTGPMGVGKTEFVKAFAGAFGIKGVASPTYAIHHQYQVEPFSVDHLDLYRLADASELDATGFWDFFSSPQGYILIEWPERMNLEQIPRDWNVFEIRIESNANVSSGSRKISSYKISF